jgi:hypothetical protein
MARKTRNTVILAKIETTSGTDAVPTGVANAILVSEPSFTNNINFVERSNLKGYFGADAPAVGSRHVQLSFAAEISGSGAAGTAPAWGPLLRACAMAEVITAGQRVEYTPVSTGIETLTIYYHDDGVVHKALGCMGTVTMTMTEGEIPKFNFTFTGIDGGEVATTNPAATLTAWKAPLAITNTNTATINLGGTYATGAITDGASFCSRGLTLDMGNEVAYVPMLGNCQGVEIKDRRAVGSMQLELTAAEEVTAYTAVKAATLTTLGFVHGTAAGATVGFFAPSVQRTNPSHQDNEGRIHIGFDLSLLPVSGNDELLIFVK